MADNVIVPIELEITNLDFSQVRVQDVQKTIGAKLSGISKSIEKVFSQIDMSKATKQLLTSMGTLENSFSKVTKAQDTFQNTADRVGKSTDKYREYNARLDEAKSKLQLLYNIRTQLEDSKGNFIGTTDDMWKSYQSSVEEYEVQLFEVKKLQRQIDNPSNFVKFAGENDQNKVANSYRDVVLAVSNMNKEIEKFNRTSQDNATTQQYKDMENEATRLVDKLREYNEKSKEMANSTHTTDRQWEKLQSDTKKTSSELDSILRKMRQLVKEGNALAIGDDTSGLTNQIKSMDATRRGIAGYGKQVGSVEARANANMNPYTAEYQEELKNFQKLEQAVDKLKAKYEELKALGKLSPDGLAKMKYEAEQLQGKLEESKSKLTEMVNNGTAFRLGSGDTESELSGINSRLNDSNDKIAEITNASANWTQSLSQVNSTVKTLTKTVNKLAAGFLKALVGVNLLSKNGKSTATGLGKAFNKLKRSVLMYGFGFRTAYYAIKRLRTLFIKEFQLMAQSSEEVNDQISRFIEVFNKLKGSLAVAFQPLATVVIPILKTAMSYLTTLLENIGRFNAVLVGQTYIYKAVAKSVNYATDSMKNANKQLASYDKLEVINKDDSLENELGITYEKQGIEGAASDFAKLVKEAWAKQDFTEVGLTIGNKLVEALNSIPWNNIRTKAKGLANSVATLINGFFAAEGLGESIGNTLAGAALTAIDFMYKAFTTIDYSKIGQVVGNTLNAFLTKMSEVDETGLSGWGKLAQSYSRLITGMLDLIIEAMSTTDWFKVGQAIGDYISNIDWGKIVLDFSKLAWEILKAIAEAFAGWVSKDPVSAIVGLILGSIVAALNVASVLIPLLLKFSVLKKFFAMADAMKGSGAAGGATTAAQGMEDAASSAEAVNNGTTNLTSKLTTLIKNLALGLVVIVEVAAAAALVVGAIWLLGIMLEQVGIAWQPVIDNAGTVAIAMGIGIAFLVVIGAATAGLGAIGPELIVALALGIAVLAEMGVATLLFIAEIWAIGKGLDEIGKAWQPVIDNGDTIKIGIETGTALLVAIGVVTAALGAATVATAGALPLAIGLGTAILVELSAAFVLFCEELKKVATELIKLSPVLNKLNGILPGLKTDMHSFTNFMKDFTGEVVKFTTYSSISGISTTVGKIIGFFTKDPIKTLQEDIDKRSGQFKNLVASLKVINPQIKEAIKLMGEYKDLMGSFANKTSGNSSIFSSIGSGAKDGINSLIKMFQGLANGVIKAVNAIITALNKINIDIPSWVPDLGGKKFKFNIAKASEITIPRLAQGAVIPPNREFLAMLGDQKSGTNIEAPLETIKQAVAEVIAQMGGVGNKPADVNLILAGKQVAKVVWDETEKKYKQTGKYSPAY